MNLGELLDRLSAYDRGLSVEVEGFGRISEVGFTDYDEDGVPVLVLKGSEEPLIIDFEKDNDDSRSALRVGGAALMALGGDANGLASILISEQAKLGKLKEKLRKRRGRKGKRTS